MPTIFNWGKYRQCYNGATGNPFSGEKRSFLMGPQRHFIRCQAPFSQPCHTQESSFQCPARVPVPYSLGILRPDTWPLTHRWAGDHQQPPCLSQRISYFSTSPSQIIFCLLPDSAGQRPFVTRPSHPRATRPNAFSHR